MLFAFHEHDFDSKYVDTYLTICNFFFHFGSLTVEMFNLMRKTLSFKKSIFLWFLFHAEFDFSVRSGSIKLKKKIYLT